MRYLSLFSGIEAASVAWHPLGWQPVAFAEIEPFPCAVLAQRFPHVPNLGDVTAITDAQVAALGPIDVVIGGSPCQDLSVAGKRAGLVGKRSSLFHEQVRIFHAARTLCGARWCVWENVPGAYSSNDGRDFAVVVGTLAGCRLEPPREGWGSEGVALGEHGLVEWSMLDAQWFGLAQRRDRVFAVLDTGDWSNRPPVLLEPESLRGDHPPRRKAGQGTAPTISARTKGGGGLGTDFDCDGGLIAGTIAFGAQNSARQGASASASASEHHSPTLDKSKIPAVGYGMQVRRLTPRECTRLQGFPDDYLELRYADAEEAHAAQILHELWRATGAIAREGWRPGIVASLLTPQILLAGVHVGWVSWEVARACAASRRPIPSAVDYPAGLMLALREAGRAGCSPYRRESFEQCARELGAHLPELPLERAQAAAELRRSQLWQEAQGAWPLRYALATPSQIAGDRVNVDGPRYKALGNSMAVPVIRWIGERIASAA